MSDQTLPADFASLLDKPLDSFVKPQPLPIGGYLWTVRDWKLVKPEGQTQEGKPKNGHVEFDVVPTQAQPDVNEEELAAVLDGKALTEKKGILRFYVTPDALWRLTQFCEHLGLQVEGRSTMALLNETKGQSFLGNYGHRPNTKNPTEPPYGEITVTAAVPQV